MKKLLPVTACAAILLPLAFGQDAQDSGPATGGLKRVEVDHEADAQGVPRTGGTFDLTQVITLLTDPDLDQRERNFDQLVRAARADRDVLRLLSDVSTSRVEPELAWTARLALREVRRGSGLSTWFGTDPLSLPLPGLDDLQGFGLFGGGLPDAQFFGPGASSSRRSIEIRQDGDEFVLRIHESKDGGEESTREYRGETLEAILDANPELRDEMDIQTEEVPGGLRFRVGPQSPTELWRKLMRDMRRGPSDVFRLFDDPDAGILKEFVQPFHSSRPIDTKILGVRVREISSAQAEELGLEEGEGLYVSSVEPGSMAHLLGVGQGSVLLKLNDEPLRAAEDISRILAARAAPDPVHLLWIDGTGEKRSNVWRPGS